MRKLLFLLICVSTAFGQVKSSKLKFEISFPAAQSAEALDGRVLLAISKDDKQEPRFGIDEQEARSQQLFGMDVEGLKPGAPAVVDASALGYPMRSLDQLPAGDYYVQAVLNIYETFKRADGHRVKLPPERTPYSIARPVQVSPWTWIGGHFGEKTFPV